MLMYYFSGYSIFDFMVHLPGVNTVTNGLASVGNGVGHALNATINKIGRSNPKSFKKPFPENTVGWTVSNFTKQSSYGGKSKKLRKSLKPRRKSRKTRRKSNNKRSTKRSRK